MKLFVTYGYGTRLRHGFSVVEGQDSQECYQKIAAVCGQHYAFAYTEDRFKGQVERYNLHEVPLQECSAYRPADRWTEGDEDVDTDF
jgi:hypothetical protein